MCLRVDFISTQEELGIGGFGSVYKCTLGKTDVANKVMFYNERTTKICDNEKEIMEHLTEVNAPNIVTCYGYEYRTDKSGKKTLCIQMEYMENGDLTNYIEVHHRTPLTWQQRYKIMCQITEALVFMHHENYIYADLKGANVLLDANFNAKFCDFGLTHKRGGKRKCGTIANAAPEILLADGVTDFATDVYSLAITFWQLAAWCKPYRGMMNLEIVEKLKSSRNRLDIPGDTPPKIAKLITWGWAENPDDRPTAKQVLDELVSDDMRFQIKLLP